MQFDAQCIECLIRRQRNLAEPQQDPEGTYQYLREVMELLLQAPEGVAARYMIPLFDDAFARRWPGVDHYGPLKEASNRDMLARLPEIRRIVAASEDPVLTALKFAQTGNYIDYGALAGGVDPEVLDRMIAETPQRDLDPEQYRQFLEDVSRAGKLLYIGDNAGEIVADMVFMEELLRRFPGLSITFAVRGAAALNDVTREDAAAVGLDKLVPIVDNGTRIPGTELAYVGEEMRRCLQEADVILSKGQANFETLATSGLNIYYIFLCKCPRFTRLFNVPMLTGMFLNERQLHFDSPYC